MVLSATTMHSHAKAQPNWFFALAIAKFWLSALRESKHEIYPHYLSIGVRS